MTERWKLELVDALNQIAKTLPELTEELGRLNEQLPNGDSDEDRTEIDTTN